MPKSKYKKAIKKAVSVANPTADLLIRTTKRLKKVFGKKKRSKKEKEIAATHLSRGSRRQLHDLSEGDYKAVMKILRGKK